MGLKCPHACKFCYYSFLDGSAAQFRGLRRARFRSLQECKTILRLLQEQGLKNFDFTGGEPTLHPDLICLTRYAHQELGLTGRLITLGQFLLERRPRLGNQRLIEALLEAGLTNFLFSIHAPDEDLFHRVTGASLGKLRSAMRFLDERGFHYTGNTTVFAWNYQTLPSLARELVRHGIYLHNFILMNAYYEWNKGGRACGIQARYADIRPYLQEAVAILEEHRVAVNVRYAPLCAMKGMEKNLVGVVGVRYDPYEWRNQGGHHGGDPEFCASLIPIQEGQVEAAFAYQDLDLPAAVDLHLIGTRGGRKFFPEACRPCQARLACDGLDLHYLKRYGAGELTPYEEPASPPLLAARRAYTPAFLVKLSQFADMKQAVSQAFAAPPVATGGAPAGPPRVSVVIPCFNYARFLPEAVASVVNQTCRDWEIIIVNDGSTDNSREVAEHLIASHPDRRLRLINQPNSGQPAVSRNRGIEEAQGEFILCLDADDRLAPTMLAECLEILEQQPQVAIAYTDRLDFDGAHQVVQAGDYDFSRLRYHNHLSYCALFRREVWEKVGGYRTNVKGVEDWDFWVAAGVRGFFGRRLPKPLFHYRRHEAGVFQEALRDFEGKRAQVMLNNWEVYPPRDLEAACRVLGLSAGEMPRPTPMVSVIIPTYNRPESLAGALMSVLAQTYQNFEIIVVNDGGEEVKSLVRRLSSGHSLVYVRHPENRERSAARNTGLRLARGKYIAYLDDDDRYYPHHLHTLVTYLENSEFQAAYTDACRHCQQKVGPRYETVARDVPYSMDFDPEALLVRNYIPILTLMHARSCLEKTGLFDEALSTHEDWDLLIRLSQHYPLKHLKHLTAEFTWLEDDPSTNARRADFVRTMEMVHARYHHLVQDKPHLQRLQRQQLSRLREAVQAKRKVFGPAGSPEELLAAAQAAMAQRAWEEAEEQLRQGMARFPECLPAYPLLAQVLKHQGKSREAAAVLTAAKARAGTQPLLPEVPAAGAAAPESYLPHNPECSIIIPVYNNLALTRQCLESLQRHTDLEKAEVIVVDNGSTDDTPGLLSALAAQGRVRYRRNPLNLGFSQACNQGALAALGEFLLFLNNDTVVTPGWLRALVETVRRHPQVAVAGAKLLYPDDTVQHAGVAFSQEGRPYHIYRHFHRDHPAVNKLREFQVVTGACLLVRRLVFFQAGLFDPVFQNGFEDVDLCLRIRTLGYRILYTPESVVYHLESKTPGRFAREAENSRHLAAKWQGRVNPDDVQYYQEDGLRLTWTANPGGLKSPLIVDANANPFKEEARAHLQRGELAQALALYEQALKFNPFDPRNRGLLAELEAVRLAAAPLAAQGQA